MKKITLLIAAALLSLAPRMSAQDSTEYRVLKICESDYVIHTSDGADAGRIEYIVLDPEQNEIVSAIVSGGIVADRYVTLPFSVFRLGSSRDVILTEVDRARLINAPVIERTRIINSTTFDRVLVERSYSQFGLDVRNRQHHGRDRDDRGIRGTTQADAPPRTNRGFASSDSDRRRTQEPGRQTESSSKNSAVPEAQSQDKNAAARDREERNRPQSKDQRPGADSTAAQKRNAASTAKEDALTEKRDHISKENALPEKRDSSGKADAPPEKTRDPQAGRNGAGAANRRNPEARGEEKKNQGHPDEPSQKAGAAKGSKEPEAKERKGTQEATPKSDQPTSTKSVESKEKDKNQRAKEKSDSPEAGQRPGEEKGRKPATKPEEDLPKRKPQP